MQPVDQARAVGQISRRLTGFAPLLILLLGAGCLAHIVVTSPRRGVQVDYFLVASAAVFHDRRGFDSGPNLRKWLATPAYERLVQPLAATP